MRTKINFLIIIILVSSLSLACVSANEMSQNITSNFPDEDAVLSDGLYFADDFDYGTSVIYGTDEDNTTSYMEVTCVVGPESGIVRNASMNFSGNGIEPKLYAASKGTYDVDTGIWSIGEFHERESLMIFFYNDNSSKSWQDFKQTDTYANILKDYVALNQTNKLINPDASERIPYYIDLIISGNFTASFADEGDFAVFVRNFTVESNRGVAENTTVEYRVEDNFIYQYYEATKGTYDETAGIWNVGDVYGPENLCVYLLVNRTYLISNLNNLGLRDVTARTTAPEINTLNNIFSITTPVSPTSSSDMISYHYQLPHFEDYSDYRVVETQENGETKEIPHEEYKQRGGGHENPGSNETTPDPVGNQTDANSTASLEDSNSLTGQNNSNVTSGQQNMSFENRSNNFSIDKSISPSSSNIWIVLAVLILAVAAIVIFKKFKS